MIVPTVGRTYFADAVEATRVTVEASMIDFFATLLTICIWWALLWWVLQGPKSKRY
jgi:hypothetical protein